MQSTFIIGQLSTTYHRVRRLDCVAFGSDSQRKSRSVASSARGQNYRCEATSADLPLPIEAEGDSLRSSVSKRDRPPFRTASRREVDMCS